MKPLKQPHPKISFQIYSSEVALSQRVRLSIPITALLGWASLLVSPLLSISETSFYLSSLCFYSFHRSSEAFLFLTSRFLQYFEIKATNKIKKIKAPSQYCSVDNYFSCTADNFRYIFTSHSIKPNGLQFIISSQSLISTLNVSTEKTSKDVNTLRY